MPKLSQNDSTHPQKRILPETEETGACFLGEVERIDLNALV